METNFCRVVVIGYGKAAGDILKYIADRRLDYLYQLEFIEHEPHALSVTENICTERDIPFRRIPEKEALARYLNEISEKTLIVSASNNFLFPRVLVEKETITIINFHNALLPNYPGRNAPSWVIYKGERETGITWHYVTAGVDEGNIIVQKRCEIGLDEKAYELTERLMNLACEGFAECFDKVLTERAQAVPQNLSGERRMYLSKEIPGDGFLDLAGDAEAAYRLLRSVDYGKSEIFPPLRLSIEGREAVVVRYRKVAPEKREEGENLLYLPLRSGEFLKIKYRVL